MGKILSVYKNNQDKAWFDSSNVLYAECDDKDNELKEVRVTFKNVNTYAYHNVKVTDWLLFRESSSIGKGLNAYIKQYEYEKLPNGRDVDDIKNELQVLLEEINKKNEKDDGTTN